MASKIVSMFTLSKQLLSTQQHYDWGLRALKAVLNTGGKLIQVADYLVKGGEGFLNHRVALLPRLLISCAYHAGVRYLGGGVYRCLRTLRAVNIVLFLSLIHI